MINQYSKINLKIDGLDKTGIDIAIFLSTCLCCATLLFILCYGDPDILDGLIKIANN